MASFDIDGLREAHLTVNAYSHSLVIQIMKLKPTILFFSITGLAVAQAQTSLPITKVEGRPSGVFTAPVVLGLRHERHGLGEVQQGRLLAGELLCMSCHSGTGVVKKVGPNLMDVGRRVDPSFIKEFIINPMRMDPGTQMPSLLEDLPKAKRDEAADALTHFLVSLSAKEFAPGGPNKEEYALGKKLFHRIGCASCHGSEQGVNLLHVPLKYGMDSLTAFLFQPRHVRPSGRMPDMNLTRGEARSIAGYLIGLERREGTGLKPVAVKVAAGKKYFEHLNCASCHELPGIKAEMSLAFGNLRAGKGCLSVEPMGVPHFYLSNEQRETIGKALNGIEKPFGDQARIQQTMAAFNCIACHTRDGAGGVSDSMFTHFGTDEEGLGNPARIPPTLDGVGVKLKPEWLRKVLFDAETVRPYMHTRMPQFGEANLQHLPMLLEKVDRLQKVEFPEVKRDNRRKYRESGHLLVGDKGLNCVACHNFNGKPSLGLKGLDLLTSFDRLQPSWFAHFMRDPQKFRPGIVMPNYWPGGEAVRKDVLEGNPDKQLLALWYYFSLGRSARDPSGIRAQGTGLKVSERTRVYRGRSRIAGYRGIAVGFPGGVNYAFNAQNGTLSALWSGEFVNVSWSGQGAGNFNPRARPVELAQDVAFYRLDKDDAPWPLRPVMDKDNPVNPNPLYPRNLGYQFKGYQLDDEGVPTFMYRTGEVAVEDRVNGVGFNQLNRLDRRFRFDASRAETVYLRALTGKVRPLTPKQFVTDAVKMWVPEGIALLRGEGDTRELLLKLKLPKGKSQVGIRYELLR